MITEKKKEQLLTESKTEGLIKLFIFKAIGKNIRTNYDTYSDLVSEGKKILVERIDTYDESRGAFSTWVFTMLRNYLLPYYRKTYEEPKELYAHSIQEITYKFETDDDTLKCMEDPKTTRTMEDYLDGIFFLESFNRLPERERTCAELISIGYSPEEIAETMNLKKPKQIYHIRNRILYFVNRILNSKKNFNDMDKI